jgi:integrase
MPVALTVDVADWRRRGHRSRDSVVSGGCSVYASRQRACGGKAGGDGAGARDGSEKPRRILRRLADVRTGQVGTLRTIADLRLDDIRVEAVLAFLQHVESVRGNSVVTRNCRLAAIRSLVEHLLRHDLSRADQYGRILAVPTKKTSERPVQYLEPEDVRAVVAQIDGSRPMGRRDRALVLFLYNTGARVAEALTVRPRDLQLQRPRQVRLFGKCRHR